MKKKSRTQWKKLQTMKDENIDVSDIPPLDAQFFKNTKLHLPKAKSTITMRLDPDILDWFKEKGKGYQTRINAVLRIYMESQHR